MLAALQRSTTVRILGFDARPTNLKELIEGRRLQSALLSESGDQLLLPVKELSALMAREQGQGEALQPLFAAEPAKGWSPARHFALLTCSLWAHAAPKLIGFISAEVSPALAEPGLKPTDMKSIVDVSKLTASWFCAELEKI